MTIEIEYSTGETCRAEVPEESFGSIGACLLGDDSVHVMPVCRKS